MRISLGFENRTVPSVPPPDSGPPRMSPTTQVIARVQEWPDNTIQMWFPEIVYNVWSNSNPEVGLQQFLPTAEGGLSWQFKGEVASIEATVTPTAFGLSLDVEVANDSTNDLPNIAVDSCIQFASAPDFACDDMTRLFIRSKGRWSSIAEMAPDGLYHDYPCFYAEPGKNDLGSRELINPIVPIEQAQVEQADHPLIVCEATDGSRSIATAAKDFQFLYHNRANANLLCLHSSPKPVSVLAPHEQANFLQDVFFVSGDLKACIATYEQRTHDMTW